ncbi:hypothetical protein HM1_2914 [Heliomicrobium modesticaldum Ice1]|uniref:Uncharacterized protein n=1 Tax=Heliobacterium modesticaldum (strain ATCC 51547 / Ice1) TaxID=498761 RepID=B0TCX2_HELMI|nr:hypothetical protein HM1_2914 [Heliomicrobium modesticaldum Ice1]
MKSTKKITINAINNINITINKLSAFVLFIFSPLIKQK